MLHGNLGVSITLRENVSTLIASRIWTTAGLVLYASIIIVVVGIGLGVARPRCVPASSTPAPWCRRPSRRPIPAFVAAIGLILRLRREARAGSRRSATAPTCSSNIRHFTLPAIALAISSLAIVARVTRATVRAESGRDHVQTAISRGIPTRQLLRRHVLRNAAIPITTITGITIASLIAVSAVVETAFSLNGLGAYLVQAAESKDIAVVQGISLVLVPAFVVVNLLVDVAYALLDPRVILGARAQ